MVEFDSTPDGTPGHDESGTGAEVDWETIARQELGVTLHHHARTVDQRVNSVVAALRAGEPIDPATVHQFRTAVEQLESTVTMKLTQINELDRDSEAERLERMGHELLQQFHQLARSARQGESLDDTRLTELEHALAEAKTLLPEFEESADSDDGPDGTPGVGAVRSRDCNRDDGGCE